MKRILLPAILCFTFTTVNAQQVLLYGTIKNCSKDTIRCVLQENSVIRKSRTYYIPVVNGDFKISIPVHQPTYLYIQEENNWAGGMVSPGEDIGILYDSKNLNSTLTFLGSAKDKCIWAMEYTGARLARQMDPQTKIAKEKPNPAGHLIHFFDSAQDYHLTKLQQIKNIDSATFNILKGHVEGSSQYYKYSSLARAYGEPVEKILVTRRQQLGAATVDAMEKLLRFQESYYNSPVYCEQLYNVVNMHVMELIMTKRLGNGLKEKYAYLDSLLPGRLKVPLMTMVLEDDINNNKPVEEIQSMIDYVYAFPATPDYKEYILSQLARKVYFKKGMKAPDFVVENEKGQKLNLSSFKGKVVYMDFWFATCGPCHGLFSMIKPVKEHFKNNKDVVFLTISVDDKEQWKKALKTFTIGGLHAYTENKERHHAILKDYKVQEYPTTFLIDKNGQIFLAHPSGAPEELQRQIEEALKL
jgi:cytochrome oxidase Cu insertion factor (SCO1/SenC/PrrC family)